MSTLMSTSFSGLLLLASVCSAQQLSGSGPPPVPTSVTSNLILTAQINTNRLVANQPLVLTAELANSWTNNVRIALVHKHLDCKTTVRDAGGEVIPLSRYGKKLTKLTGKLGDYVMQIPPKGTCSFQVPLDRLHDLTYPEPYTVIGAVRVFLQIGGGTRYVDIESRPLSFTILRQP